MDYALGLQAGDCHFWSQLACCLSIYSELIMASLLVRLEVEQRTGWAESFFVSLNARALT